MNNSQFYPQLLFKSFLFIIIVKPFITLSVAVFVIMLSTLCQYLMLFMLLLIGAWIIWAAAADVNDLDVCLFCSRFNWFIVFYNWFRCCVCCCVHCLTSVLISLYFMSFTWRWILSLLFLLSMFSLRLSPLVLAALIKRLISLIGEWVWVVTEGGRESQIHISPNNKRLLDMYTLE